MKEFIAKLKIKKLEPADASKAMALSLAANWNQTHWDWTTLIQAPGDHLAVQFEGDIVATTIAINYGQFSWIAMVLVHPDFRRRGIATLLLNQILSANSEVVFRLDATPEGAKVYEGLGFKQIHTIHRWYYPGAIKIGINLDQPKSLEPEDLSKIIATDKGIFGADRTAILSALFDKYPYLVLTGSDPGAYMFGRFGTYAHQIGPLIATRWEEASTMLQQLISLYPFQSFYLDSFTHTSWEKELQRIGFNQERQLFRMQKNSSKSFGLPEQQFAIAGPELG